MPDASDESTSVASSRTDDLTAAMAGDARAFARLVAPFRARLGVFLMRRGRDVLRADSDVEDLLQQVLHTAWQRLPTFEDRGDSAMLRWLTAIARHAIHDRAKYLDAKGRRDTRNASSSVFDALADSVTSVPGRVHRRMQAERLHRALAQLADTHREVVERHLLEARSLADIAAELGITKNAAWERLRRGLLRLRDALREELR